MTESDGPWVAGSVTVPGVPNKDIHDRCTCGHIRGDHGQFFGLPSNACEVYGCMCQNFTMERQP